METLFSNEYFTISIDESVPCLEWIGKKFMPSEAFRLSERKSLEFYLEYKDKYPNMEWFVDARYIGVVLPEDTKWVVDEILPQFVENGLTKEAFVLPKSAISQLMLKRYKKEATSAGYIEIGTFDNIEDAKNWLKK